MVRHSLVGSCVWSLVWGAALLVGIGSASARDIFVDNLGGDDRNNGSSAISEGRLNGPTKTITKALRIARTGDRVILRANVGEPYRECVTLQGGGNSGFLTDPLEIMGNGAVLDGTVSLADAAWHSEKGDIFSVQPARMSYQQLFLDGQPAQRLEASGATLPALQPLQWCLVQGRIYFRVEPGRLPRDYNPSCCGHTVGITLYDVHDVVIHDLTIRGFQLDGLNAHDTVFSTDIVNVISLNNGRSGFSVGGSSRVRLDECSAGGNGQAQVRTEGYCQVRRVGGKFDEATAPALRNEGGQVVEER